MKSNTAKKQIQMMAVPKVNTIKKYDNFNNYDPLVLPNKKVVERKRAKSRTNKAININVRIVMRTFVIASVLMIAMMIQMKFTYEVSNLGRKKSKLETRLDEAKSELENLENVYLSNFDFKQIEIKAKEMGFVYNDSIKYINLK